MQASLNFKLPEETDNLKCALKGRLYHDILKEIRETVRKMKMDAAELSGLHVAETILGDIDAAVGDNWLK